MRDVPKRIIDRITRNVTKDFAPGDKVYMVREELEESTCPLCMGKKKVPAIINVHEVEVQCPECKGFGKKREHKGIVTEKTIERVDLRLCFESNRIGYWETECIRLYGYDFNISVESLFKTKDEALKELDRREREKGSKNRQKAKQ